MSSRLPPRGLPSYPADLSLSLPATAQRARHLQQSGTPQPGLRRDCIGNPFRRPPSPSPASRPLPSSRDTRLTRSASRISAPGALGEGGADSPLHLPSPPLPPPPHPAPWYFCTERNPTHPSTSPGNRQQSRQDRQHTEPEQPSGCVRVKATRPGDRVPCAAPHDVLVGRRYYYYCLLANECSNLQGDYGPCAHMR